MRDPPDSAVLKSAVLRTPLDAGSREPNVVPLRQLVQTGAEVASHQQARSESFTQRLLLALFRALAAWPH